MVRLWRRRRPVRDDHDDHYHYHPLAGGMRLTV
jgi:hypothetical protein